MFGNDSWVSETIEAVNGDEQFRAATEHVDGSIAFEIGDETRWVKLYRGECIDSEPYVPQFGATFRIVGDRDSWRRVAAGDTSFSEALYQTSLRTKGNKLEANRLRDGLELFVRHLQQVTPDDTEQMEAQP